MLSKENHTTPNAQQWQRLDFVVADRQRPTVLWMACDDPDRRHIAIKALLERYGERFIHLFYDLREWKDGELTAFIERSVGETARSSEPCRYMVHLTGLEDKVAGDSPNDSGALQTINFERELLFSRFPFLTVFWSDSSTQDEMRRQAPDFWDWVTNKFYLA